MKSMATVAACTPVQALLRAGAFHFLIGGVTLYLSKYETYRVSVLFGLLRSTRNWSACFHGILKFNEYEANEIAMFSL